MDIGPPAFVTAVRDRYARIDPSARLTATKFATLAVRLVRVAGLVVWVYALLMVPTTWRPDLIHPGDIGSDTSNYIAAAERLADGHELYALAPGDRPAPLDNPPQWSVPMLSPPPVATVYLWTTWLPDPIGFHLGWAAGLAALVALGVFVAVSAPVPFVVALVYFSSGLAVTAWSGNVNALIAPAAATVWWAGRRSSPRWELVAGAVVAIATLVKIGPAVLGLWLLASRRWRAVLGAMATGAAIGLVTIVAAGPEVLSQYFAVARETARSPTELSIPGILRSAGVPGALRPIGLVAAMLAATLAILVLGRSRLSFTIAIVAMVFATTVVRPEAVAIAIVAIAAAWTRPAFAEPDRDATGPATSRTRISPSAVAAIGIGVAFAIGGVGVSLATDGLSRSSVAVTNATGAPLVARFTPRVQIANFGFRIEPGQSAYGWIDRFGASPSDLTIWTADCRLLGRLDLPRAGGHVEVRDGGPVLDDALPGRVDLAGYVPDCAVELIDYRNGRVATSR